MSVLGWFATALLCWFAGAGFVVWFLSRVFRLSNPRNDN